MKAALLVTDTSIKLVKDGSAVPQCLRIPLEKGIIVDGAVVDEGKFKLLLTKLRDTYALKGREIILGLPESVVITKSSILDEHLPESVTKEEIVAHVHTSTNNEIFDCIPSLINETQVVFFASIDEKLVKKYRNIFHEVGIPLVRVEPLASAVSRALSSRLHTPALLVDLEEQEVILALLSDTGHIQQTASIPRSGLANVEELVNEISRFVQFVYRKFHLADIERQIQKPYLQGLFLTGESLNDQMKNLFQNALKLPVSYAFIEKVPHMQDALGFYSVNALLADPQNAVKRDINLLENTHEEVHSLTLSEDVQKYLKIGTVILGIYCLLYAAGLGYMLYQTSLIDHASKDVKKQEVSPEVTALKTRLSELDKTIYLITQLKTKDTRVTDTLSFLIEKAPEGIVITHYQIDFEKNAVVLTGVTTDRDTLSSFSHIIETDQRYQNINVPLTNFEKKGVTPFSLSFEYKQ